MNYEDRVTVFIDILGFKDLLNKTVVKGEDQVDKINEILSAYQVIRDVWNLDRHDEEPFSISKKVTTFSDCLVISFKASEESEIFHTLREIQWMIMRLIFKGILVRGAVTYGKLIHTNDVLFGPALAEAYLLETKAALYPRVILHKDIIDLAGKASSFHHSSNQEREYVESLLEKDCDGIYYVDYFGKAQSELDDPDYDFPIYLEKISKRIRKGLKGSSNINKSDIKVKYRWMKERYNKLVDKLKDKEYIKYLRENGEFELADTYLKFKKINPIA